MFYRLFEMDDRGGRDERCFNRDKDFGHGQWRHGWGGRGGFGGGFGRNRERMFDNGEIKLVILKLLSEQPSYGYQLMKSMEERMAGGYTPSAGVIYPTLTMLEEEGLIAAEPDSARKTYSVTPEGQQFLEENKKQVDELFERLEEAGKNYERWRSPEIMGAVKNLFGAVVAKVSRDTVTREQIVKIAEAINTAAKTIDGI